MTDEPLLTLMTESDCEALRLTDDDLERLLLGQLAHCDAEGDSNPPTSDAPHQTG